MEDETKGRNTKRLRFRWLLDAATEPAKSGRGGSAIDDDLMMKYLEGEEVSEDEIRKALRTGTLAMKIVPVVTGSAFKNKGVQTMLDAVVDFLPSPLDVPPIEGINPRTDETETREANASAPFSGLVFKLMADKHLGQLSFVRIYSGTVKAGSYVYNTIKNQKERVGRLMFDARQ